jgi:septum site-determining protein MinD
LQDIFLYRQEGLDKRGKILGKFQASGFIPKFIEVLERRGYNVPRGLFVTADQGVQAPPAAAPAQAQPAKPATATPSKPNTTNVKKR